MHYETLFKRAAGTSIRAALVGAGEFGVSFIFQSRFVPGLDVSAVCTRTVEKAVQAYDLAGIPAENVEICQNRAQVEQAFLAGRKIVVSDGSLLMNLPLDVLVEGTGMPEVGAVYAEAALNHNMHVVMVSKEVDSVVGPILGQIAKEKGLVYTTGEGDQPSLLIGLISWARSLGMDIIAAGKSGEYDFVFDPLRQIVTSRGQIVKCSAMTDLWNFDNRSIPQLIQQRSLALSALPQRSAPDLCEMTVVANATGLKPFAPDFLAPIARIPELSDLFCPQEDGGILNKTGGLDMFNCLRREDEPSMAGGVFVVIRCHDYKSWQVLKEKGHVVSEDGRYAMIYRPAHLLGVETPISVLAAVLMKHATGGENLTPVCDMVGCATADLKAGTILNMGGHHHTIEGIAPLMVDACRIEGDNPIPFYMMSNAKLVKSVSKGSVITCNMVELPVNSTLKRLRRQQDSFFKLP